MRAYLERARGHSKTTDISVVVAYLLCFAQRPLRCYAYAADRDQAGLLRDACQRLVRLNPWIAELLSVEKDRIVNAAPSHPGYDSILKFETSDVGSSFGILPDAIIFDELTHWPTNAEPLWGSLISSAAKRENCLMLGISNAGHLDSWQWKVREAIRLSDDWVFSRLDGPKASWLSERRLNEQRQLLPSMAFNRLWMNEWSSGAGDALRPEDIECAFDSDCRPMGGAEPDYRFVAGLDIGLTRDATAVVVLAVGETGTSVSGQIRLAATRIWRPVGGQKISLLDVESEMRQLVTQFNLDTIGYDPWQAQHIADRLRFDGVECREINPTGKNLQDIASRVLEVFNDRRLVLYEDPNLRRDLMKLRFEERSYGFRLTSPRDQQGHGDTFSAFANAVLCASEVSGRPMFIAGPWF